MPRHFIMFSLFHYLQPLSLHPPSSVPHPPFCLPSLHHSVILIHLSVFCHTVTLSPSFPSFVLCHTLITSPQHPFITPCLPIPTLSTLHSISCDSMSHFLHSPYYRICCTSPSLVVFKSFKLVVIP